MDNAELLAEFKALMRYSHASEDTALLKTLARSAAAVQRLTGAPDALALDSTRELVLQRARYDVNEALEYFEDNFLSEIMGAQLEVTLSCEPDPAEEPPGGWGL